MNGASELGMERPKKLQRECLKKEWNGGSHSSECLVSKKGRAVFDGWQEGVSQ